LQKRKVFASWEEPKGVYSVHISPNGRIREKVWMSAGQSLPVVVVQFAPDGKTLAGPKGLTLVELLVVIAVKSTGFDYAEELLLTIVPGERNLTRHPVLKGRVDDT
jgi:hypothetical protein